MTKIPDDAQRLTWNEVYDLAMKLARQIEAHCQKTGERFDGMVVVPRGGYNPASIVSYKLGFRSVDLQHACIGTYEANSTDAGDYLFGQMPDSDVIKDKSWLIIEDVCDRGRTLQYLTNYLQETGAKLVRSGVLHYKPGQTQTGFVPDWSVEQTEDWIVYPWELPEITGQSTVVKRTD